VRPSPSSIPSQKVSRTFKTKVDRYRFLVLNMFSGTSHFGHFDALQFHDFLPLVLKDSSLPTMTEPERTLRGSH
jgi:hypothetical protein